MTSQLTPFLPASCLPPGNPKTMIVHRKMCPNVINNESPSMLTCGGKFKLQSVVDNQDGPGAKGNTEWRRGGKSGDLLPEGHEVSAKKSMQHFTIVSTNAEGTTSEFPASCARLCSAVECKAW